MYNKIKEDYELEINDESNKNEKAFKQEDLIKKNFNIKKYIKVITILLVSILLAVLLIYQIIKKFKFENIERIIIGNGKEIKIGFISDFQLSYELNNQHKIFMDNLIETLQYLKEEKIELIIIPGDILNDGNESSYKLFNEIFYSIYTKENQPKVLSIMGNHEYYPESSNNKTFQKSYKKYIGNNINRHLIINGVNFILWSNDNGNIGDEGIIDTSWIKKHLKLANNNLNNKGDPIFVITHMPPNNTVYGSKSIWGSAKIYEEFKNYNNIISISGHSHYSLINERSIWQGEFTAINTQSISYVDLDRKFENYREVKEKSLLGCSMGLIGYLTQNNIIFQRVFFKSKELIQNKWQINFPITSDNFQYTDLLRAGKSNNPIFDNKEIDLSFDAYETKISFQSASDVFYYKVLVENKDKNIYHEYLFYSDYYLPKNIKKSNYEKFKIPLNNIQGNFTFQIKAVGFFGKESEAIEKIIYKY